MSVPHFNEVRVENTNACGYKCVMCPREKQTRGIGYMSVEDFSLILERVGSVKRDFHLHGFGEPLLDRKLIPKLELLKKHSPGSHAGIFSTLGVRVKEDYFFDLMKAGLNTIVVSLYGFTRESYKKVHSFDGFELVKRNLGRLAKINKLKDRTLDICIKVPANSLSSSLPQAQPEGKKEFVDWAKSEGFELAMWNYVHNYGDGRHYNEGEKERICPVVSGRRRNILNITWDLHVIPCCFDFNASIRFGNLREQTLQEIFSSSAYFQFLVAQQSNALDSYSVCKNCEKIDY